MHNKRHQQNNKKKHVCLIRKKKILFLYISTYKLRVIFIAQKKVEQKKTFPQTKQ